MSTALARRLQKVRLFPDSPSSFRALRHRYHTTRLTMGKKKARGEYNEFIDGEKLRDNAQVRTSLSGASTSQIPPPSTRRESREKETAPGKKPNKRPQLTHFLCLPLVTGASRLQLEKSLEGFKKELENDGVVPLKAVRPIGTLHLTLGVMALDEKGLEVAGKCLEELDLKKLLRNAMATTPVGKDGQAIQKDRVSVLSDQQQFTSEHEDMSPLSIDLRGLIPMQPRHKVSIMYAEPVDATWRLYPFASALRDHFTAKGLLVQDSRPLKLHATLINTIYAKPRVRRPSHRPQAPQVPPNRSTAQARVGLDRDASSAWLGPRPLEQDRGQGHGPNAKCLISFDASDLIARYSDFAWAENVGVERVQICKMGAKKVLNEEGEVMAEEYQEVHGRRIDG